MRKTLLIIAMILANLNIAQNVNIPDTNFKNALLAHGETITGYGISKIDTNNDGEIQLSEANVYSGKIIVSYRNISNLTGIEAFINLTILFCNDNQLTSLDVSQNTVLDQLSCSYNQITNLDVSQNNALTRLYCRNNPLTSLDISQNTNLLLLNCINNQLTSLDITQNNLLQWLYCEQNPLTSLDVTQNGNLIVLNCVNNQLTGLNVSQNTALEQLVCNNNSLASLNVSQNTALKELECSNNQLTSLDVSNNTSLRLLWCSFNQLTTLDVSQNSVLGNFRCHGNQLTSLNVANGNNSNMPNGNFFISNNPSLTCVQVDDQTYSNATWTNKDSWTSYSNNCALSVNDFGVSKQIVFYPNPVKDVLTIQNQDEISFKNYSVLDINGRVLVSQSKAIQNNQINLSGLTSGIYMLQLETDKGFITKKIIKE